MAYFTTSWVIGKDIQKRLKALNTATRGFHLAYTQIYDSDQHSMFPYSNVGVNGLGETVNSQKEHSDKCMEM